MSKETATEGTADSLTAPEKSAPEPKRRSTGRWLLILMLLLLLVVPVVYFVWQNMTSAQPQEFEAEVPIDPIQDEIVLMNSKLNEMRSSFNRRIAALEEVVQTHAQTTADLDGAIRATARLVENPILESTRMWEFAQLDYLLSTANVQLEVWRNVDAAIRTLESVDEILVRRERGTYAAVRTALAQDLIELRAHAASSESYTVESLERLQTEVRGLFADTLRFRGEPVGNPTNDAADSGDSAWTAIGEWFGSLVRVRVHEDAGTKPVLTPAGLELIELRLEIALEQARWALIQVNQAVFDESLRKAQELVARHLRTDATSVQRFLSDVRELAEGSVEASVPNIERTLGALRRVLVDELVSRVDPRPEE